MQKILVVEDDQGLSEGIVMTLESPERKVVQAGSVAQGRQALETEKPDLILLDINLPDGDGFAFCKEIRQQSDVPILFLTAKDMEVDIVRGLELGGDDYITKPFSLMVLRARINAVLRRRKQDPEGKRKHTVYIDDLELDFDAMSFKKQGELVSLSKTEQKLLKILVSNRGQTLSKEVLLEKVWETEFVDDHALPVTIKRLRDKLETDRIKSIYGIGYTWIKEKE